jgi:hypothetical protein
MSKQQFSTAPTSFTLQRAADQALSGQPVTFCVVGWQVGDTLELSVNQARTHTEALAWRGGTLTAGTHCATFTGSPPSLALTELVEFVATVRGHLKALGHVAPVVEIMLDLKPGVTPF